MSGSGGDDEPDNAESEAALDAVVLAYLVRECRPSVRSLAASMYARGLLPFSLLTPADTPADPTTITTAVDTDADSAEDPLSLSPRARSAARHWPDHLTRHYATQKKGLTSLDDRRRIMEFVRAGHIDEALDICHKQFPEAMANHSMLAFHAYICKYTELLRSDQPNAALDFARTTLKEFASLSAVHACALEELFALLMYPPMESQNSDLLHQAFRDMIADRMNTALLEHFGAPNSCQLEVLVRHTVVLQSYVDKTWSLAAFLNKPNEDDELSSCGMDEDHPSRFVEDLLDSNVEDNNEEEEEDEEEEEEEDDNMGEEEV